MKNKLIFLMCLFLFSLQISFAEKKTEVIIDTIPIEEFKQNNNYVYCAMEYQLYTSIGCSKDDIVLENFSDIHKMNYIQEQDYSELGYKQIFRVSRQIYGQQPCHQDRLAKPCQ